MGATVYPILMSNVGQTSGTSACLESINKARYTTDVNGEGSPGSTIYTDNTGTVKYNGSNHYFVDSIGNFKVNTVGYVSNNGPCKGGPVAADAPSDVPEVRTSSIHGYGYFATKNYRKNSKVGIWLTKEDVLKGRKIAKSSWNENEYLGMYANSSETPNTYYKVIGNNIVLFSNGIKQGEEITVRYKWLDAILLIK